MSVVDELPDWAAEMLATARVGRLGLLDRDDRPRVLPVTFALYEGALYSAIDAKPKRVAPERIARVAYLRRRPEAALTVDHYEDDWSRLAWVQVLGRVEVLEARDEHEGLHALRAKYRAYAEEPPSGPLLELVPESALCWSAQDR